MNISGTGGLYPRSWSGRTVYPQVRLGQGRSHLVWTLWEQAGGASATGSGLGRQRAV